MEGGAGARQRAQESPAASTSAKRRVWQDLSANLVAVLMMVLGLASSAMPWPLELLTRAVTYAGSFTKTSNDRTTYVFTINGEDVVGSIKDLRAEQKLYNAVDAGVNYHRGKLANKHKSMKVAWAPAGSPTREEDKGAGEQSGIERAAGDGSAGAAAGDGAGDAAAPAVLAQGSARMDSAIVGVGHRAAAATPSAARLQTTAAAAAAASPLRRSLRVPGAASGQAALLAAQRPSGTPDKTHALSEARGNGSSSATDGDCDYDSGSDSDDDGDSDDGSGSDFDCNDGSSVFDDCDELAHDGGSPDWLLPGTLPMARVLMNCTSWRLLPYTVLPESDAARLPPLSPHETTELEQLMGSVYYKQPWRPCTAMTFYAPAPRDQVLALDGVCGLPPGWCERHPLLARLAWWQGGLTPPQFAAAASMLPTPAAAPPQSDGRGRRYSEHERRHLEYLAELVGEPGPLDSDEERERQAREREQRLEQLELERGECGGVRADITSEELAEEEAEWEREQRDDKDCTDELEDDYYY